MSITPSIGLSKSSDAAASFEQALVEAGEDTSEVSARFGPGTLLDQEVLSRLSRLRPISLVSRLAFDCSLIVAMMVLCESFWHPALYLIAVMTIGALRARHTRVPSLLWGILFPARAAGRIHESRAKLETDVSRHAVLEFAQPILTS